MNTKKRTQYNQDLCQAFRDVTVHALQRHSTLVISTIFDDKEIERVSYDISNDSYITIKNNVMYNLTYDELSLTLDTVLQHNDIFKSELV